MCYTDTVHCTVDIHEEYSIGNVCLEFHYLCVCVCVCCVCARAYVCVAVGSYVCWCQTPEFK